MYRLSLIINEIYNKYLPLANDAGISLNLDFPDPTVSTKKPDTVKKALEENLGSALKRAIKGEVSINVFKDKIVVKDSGTVLSAPVQAVMSAPDRVKIESRVGFGTKVTILL